MPDKNIFLVTNQENNFNVINQIREVDKEFDVKRILIEPASLNTAPAILFAIKHLGEKIRVGFDEPILFLPADHHIGEERKFLELIRKAAESVDDSIGTFGITPTGSTISYGYIRRGNRLGDYYKVSEFKEKPEKLLAEEYFNSGEYLWNSGIYLFNIRSFIKELFLHSPLMYELLNRPMEEFRRNFNSLPAVSIDRSLSERSKNLIVFEANIGWKDISSFDDLAEIYKKQPGENPRYIGLNSKNIYVHSATNKLVATVGVEDLIIVESRDSILVQKIGLGEEVQGIVEELKKNNRKELEHNLLVHRPWGKYEVLIEDSAHQVKKITVNPGAKLSLQSHYHRVEHWVVVRGIAKIVHGNEEIILRENESTFIPALTKHRLENPGKINLEIIEVQTGSYLGEDDIQRFDDIYNRN